MCLLWYETPGRGVRGCWHEEGSEGISQDRTEQEAIPTPSLGQKRRQKRLSERHATTSASQLSVDAARRPHHARGPKSVQIVRTRSRWGPTTPETQME